MRLAGWIITLVLLSPSVWGGELVVKKVAGNSHTAGAPAEQIARAFDTHKLVGLSELHFHAGVMRYYTSLLAQPGFADSFDDIVVEFGNAAWQDQIDRYIAGEDVEPDSIAGAWRDTLYFTAWAGDVYPEFFRAVRAFNQTLPKQKRLRVVLAERAFDWNTATADSWRSQALSRDQDYLQRIRRQVLDRGRKALLIFGAFHLIRQPAPGKAGAPPSLGQLLNGALPGQTLMVWTDVSGKAFPALRSRVQETGEAQLVRAGALAGVAFADVAIRPVASEVLLAQMTDAVLLLPKEVRDMRMSADSLADNVWLSEMKRRGELVGPQLGKRVGLLLKQSVQ